MSFVLLIGKQAWLDVQMAIDYYENQQRGLGIKFETTLNDHLVSFKLNPFYAIRYDDVRCLPMQQYPYMIHFTLYETVSEMRIHAVLHTSRNPKIWKRSKRE